ncbi:Lacal_2735 family protein [Ekhidna sp.]|uniref:Lacal_2735 family protein n=1 Tax=Ekhidna sp. TaxID=2608089 RepID=UPI003BA856CF
MIRFFRKPNISSLQRQYDKLMHEAYILSKANPEQSMEKQKQALEIQREIVAKR